MLSTRFLLGFLISVAVGQKCIGDQCETPYFLEHTEVDCIGLDCHSKQSLLQLISDMQKAKHEDYLRPASNPEIRNKRSMAQVFEETITSTFAPVDQCNICNNPAYCINNGTCVADPVDPWKYYHCICPDNTSGQNCENVIDCNVTNPCGQNAICYVANHQINCICKPGYTANGNGRDCDLKVKKACMSGDPHYVTYDSLHFDYQGTCPYVFSEPCTNLSSPYHYFSVRAKNELPGAGFHVSQVSEVEVDFYNLTIHIDGRSKTTLVNGVQVLTPWYYPNKANWIIQIRFSGSTFTVQNDQGITVTFTTSNTLCVEVPDIPEFQGNQTLCGLAGNIDGKWSDDVVNRNGSVLPISNSRQPASDNHVPFMVTEDSWITDTFLKLRPGQEACINGQVIDNNTICDVTTAVQYCTAIFQAENAQGPFAPCYALGNDTLESFYYDCIYDTCRNPNYKCTALTAFLQYCQLNLPNVPQDPNWRDQVNCPLACPLNSHHSICTSSCPSTCAEPFPEVCDRGCTDGCECDPGYVIDNSVIGNIKCIRIDQCGCTDENGNIHQANKPWLSNNCSVYHECRNGTMFSDFVPCSPYGYCDSSTLQQQCRCQPGFRGDGYNCTDINECEETPGICGTHGQCFNTPGSYHCQCDTFYIGQKCDQYRPRRHCADLYVYWGNHTDGVYNLNPPYALPGKQPFNDSEVYCDMTTNGGGYTLLSSDVTNLNVDKTYNQYITGFGIAANQSVFLGLEFIYQMTNLQAHTLRLNLFRCAHNDRPAKTTDCTYPTFRILNSITQYAVEIRQTCQGSEAGTNYYEDGWARWDLTGLGPKFSTWDLEDNRNQTTSPVGENAATFQCSCSKSNLNTGWWYIEDQLCGAANLNGVRYQCPDVPLESEKYLRWSEGTLGQSWMYLRPVGYPKYE